MRAVVYEGERRVAVREVEDALVEEETDALVRITSSALCGTDLHLCDGRTGAEPGLVPGHGPLGVIEATGSAVTSVRPATASPSPPTCAAGRARTAPRA